MRSLANAVFSFVALVALLPALPAAPPPGASRAVQARTVTPLPAAGLVELSILLNESFNAEELEQLVRYALDLRLYDEIVPPGLTGRATTYRLLEATERRGATPQLLALAAKVRPLRTDLLAAIGKWCPAALEGGLEPYVRPRVGAGAHETRTGGR